MRHINLPIGHIYSAVLTAALVISSFVAGLSSNEFTASLVLLPLPLYFLRRLLRITSRSHFKVKSNPALNSHPRPDYVFNTSLFLFVLACLLTIARSVAEQVVASGGKL